MKSAQQRTQFDVPDPSVNCEDCVRLFVLHRKAVFAYKSSLGNAGATCIARVAVEITWSNLENHRRTHSA